MQLQQVVEAATRAFETDLFWDTFDRGYDGLSGDRDAWAEVKAERHGEAGALKDGLAVISELPCRIHHQVLPRDASHRYFPSTASASVAG